MRLPLVIGSEVSHFVFELEGELSDCLDEFIRIVRMLQYISEFVGQCPIQAGLALIELMQVSADSLFGQLELAQALAHLLAFAQALDPSFEYPP
jgi:hypothetical protein